MEKMLMGYLRDTFSRHAEGAKKMQLDMQDRWKNENSSDKIPDHLVDDFCLPEALCRMVEEIMELKAEVVELKRAIKTLDESVIRTLLASMVSEVQINEEV